jgi:ATP-dependent Lhr-like helicase
VESTRYPRNPLDVLAQQIVAMAGVDSWDVDDLFARIRCAAPFADLSLRMFEGVLDMLSGRYPSDEFAELRPRVTWDRVHGTIAAAKAPNVWRSPTPARFRTVALRRLPRWSRSARARR